MNHESCTRIESRGRPGVAFVISRMSFERRMDLIRRIRELSLKCEFFEAGVSAEDKLQSVLLSGEIDRLYVSWGLRELVGLDVDGVPATPELLASAGPEDLFQEALAAIKSAHSKECEDEARANQFLKNLMERAEKCQRSATRRAPRRPSNQGNKGEATQ